MRILSLHPVATELLFALGAGNQLVGRTDECIYPEAAQSVPSIGKKDEVTLDMVAVFEPQLILLGPEQQYGGAIETFHVAPQTLEEFYSIMKKLGVLLGKQVEADIIVNEMQSTFEHVQLKTAKFHLVKVHIDGMPEYVAELVRIAGGEPHRGENVEQFDPQYIITGSDQQIEILATRMPSLKAVQCERVYALDETMLRPSPRMLHGVKELAKILHGVQVYG